MASDISTNKKGTDACRFSLTFLSLQEAQSYVTVQLCDCLSMGQRVCETMLKSGKLAAWLLCCSHGSGVRGHN